MNDGKSMELDFAQPKKRVKKNKLDNREVASEMGCVNNNTKGSSKSGGKRSYVKTNQSTCGGSNFEDDKMSEIAMSLQGDNPEF